MKKKLTKGIFSIQIGTLRKYTNETPEVYLLHNLLHVYDKYKMYKLSVSV